MTAEGRREWRRLAPEMERLGLLSMADRAPFAAYCEAWSRLHSATRALRAAEKVADSAEIVRAARRAEQATEKIVRLAAEFGLTPAARAGLAVAEPKAPGEEGDRQPDDLEAFLRRREARRHASGAPPRAS